MASQTMKACIRCGSENDRLAPRCGNCGFRLPTFEIASEAPEVPVEELSKRKTEIEVQCQRVLDEEIELEEFAAFLDEMRKNLPRPHQSLVIQERGGQASNVRRDENDNWEFAHFERGIDAMVPFFDECDPQFLELGLSIIEAGNRKQIDGQVYLQVDVPNLPGIKDSVLCVVCGHQNAIGPANCSKCGARLPRESGDSSTESTGDVLVRFQRTKSMCESVRRGKTTPEEFAAFLDSEMAALKSAHDEYMESIKVADYDKESPDEVAAVLGGYREIEQGLELMYVYLHEGDDTALNKGVTMIRNGNLKCNQGFRLNAKTAKALTEKQRYL